MEFNIEDFKNQINKFMQLSSESEKEFKESEARIEKICSDVQEEKWAILNTLDEQSRRYDGNESWEDRSNRFKLEYGVSYSDLVEGIYSATYWMPSDYSC